jgi:hypothetical protein
MDKTQCYMLADMNWASGKIVRKYLEDNGWELRAKGESGVSLFYEDTKTPHVVTVIDYTGSRLNPKKFKNSVLTTERGIAHNLVDLLMDKTNIRLVSQK